MTRHRAEVVELGHADVGLKDREQRAGVHHRSALPALDRECVDVPVVLTGSDANDYRAGRCRDWGAGCMVDQDLRGYRRLTGGVGR